MIELLMGVLGPLLGKVVDTVGGKLGVDMDSDALKQKKLEIAQDINKMIHELDVKELELAIKQADINAEEAKNPNRQWPTWREALGYVCVLAIGYHFVIQQFLSFAFSAAGHQVVLPELEMTGIMTILSAMLGVHFVDSKYNSALGDMPSPALKQPVPQKVLNPEGHRPGKLIYDEQAGGMVWKED